MTAYVPDTNETDPKKIILSLQQLAAGRSNAVGTVTLTTGVSTTIVTPSQAGVVSSGSTIVLMPSTLNAAAALSTTFINLIGKDTFTINHANNAVGDRTFRWAVVG